jgi:hypothetical protein
LASAPHFLGKGNLVSCLEAKFLDVEVLESVEEIDYMVQSWLSHQMGGNYENVVSSYFEATEMGGNC